ncbi:pentatricopeptide repeat-containing protein At1g73710 [Andrographis paniculata]|uniref:pentatricopeptide repeat-containing protein At1g73710 n=1 Tax=Andrographis paniculata TaxID=175694 RepID=UPI0021E7F00F|nr:pentatricopeptide repeat-containing protein At1g73710 [Andrographis paniculata]XP_051133361.1 pentatricopeptide repeat-containing protein At1g73710 [Andrographis paniculata]
MMFRSCCAGSSADMRFSPVSSSSSCKFPTPYTLLISIHLRKYRKDLQNAKRTTSTSKDGGSPGFKLQSNSTSVANTGKTMNRGKSKKYGGILPSVLRDLESEQDIENTLDMYYGNLNPKEQTVILKEQRRWEKVVRIFDWFKSQRDYNPNVIHYNIVLRALGRAQKWDELRLYWIEMARKGVVPTNNTYGMLVDVYGKAGLVKEALLWIKHMKVRGMYPDEVTMSTVVKVLKDAREYCRADRFYKDWCVGKIELDGLNLDSISDGQAVTLKEFLSTELFRTGGRSHGRDDAKDAESFVGKPRLTSTYNTLIDLYGKAGRLKEAADVFADMLKEGVAPDAFTFNTMIFICGSHGDLLEAEALLEKMEERGISPDTKTYNIFISLYVDAENIDAVLRCYRKIQEVGLRPDDVTHRAVLKILSERNMIQEVEDVVSEMEKLGRRIDESSLPLLARMYVDAGNLKRSKLLVHTFQLYGELSSKTCAAVMDVYAEKGHWAEAEALFDAKKDGCGKKTNVLEYNVMIKAYGKAGKYDKALSLFRGMRNQGVWPDECTFNSLIQMFAGGDLADQATDILDEMQEAGFKPKCSTFSAVIGCLGKNKRLPEAVAMFQEMLRADVKPNDVVYGLLIDAFAEEGQFEEVQRYFDAMGDAGIPANRIVLTSMIKAYGKIGHVEGAKQMYEKMKMLDGGPDIAASNSMIKLYAELGMLSEVQRMFDSLRENGSADEITYTTMMYLYKNTGMLKEAIEVADELKNSSLPKDCMTYNKLMTCYAANGQLVECGELLHEMVMNLKLSPDEGTFKAMFTILKKGGIPIEAVKQLESSYEEGKSFVKQAVITSVFSVVGLHSYALEGCGISGKGSGGLDTSVVYNAAIRAYTAYGKIDKALNMFMKMQDEGIEPDVVTMINLVKCYGKAGMLEGVKRVHSQLKYGAIQGSESLYKAVADAYKTVNRNDLARLVMQEMKYGQEFSDSEGVHPSS